MSFQEVLDEQQSSAERLLGRIDDRNANKPNGDFETQQQSATKAIRKLRELISKILVCVKNIGTRNDSAQNREILHMYISETTSLAEKAKQELDKLHDCTTDPSLTTSVKRKRTLQHKRLVKDFKFQCEQFEIHVKSAQDAKEPPSFVQEASSSGEQSVVEDQLLSETVLFNQEELAMRENEFANLQHSVTQLNEIFRTVAVYVDRQEEDVNLVEQKVTEADEQTNQALNELLKSSTYRRKVNPFAFWLMVILLLVAIVSVIVVVSKKN
mmetsp:Transcript_6987/g.11086  ORF Transcript_6987/g.11086 Transcript_6987/m.11086 type:complete len:269 (+) Transcript_6987:363-1169(+)